MRNRAVILRKRSGGIPQAEDFSIETVELGEPSEGSVTVQNLFLSVEPAMRGWIADEANYATRVEIGSVMRSFAVGEVIASHHPDFSVGEIVTGLFGWREFANVEACDIERKILDRDLPLSLNLGVLGLNGLTAYFGLLRIGEPHPGDTIVVSTAAGAVGSAVGQIAKIRGCRTIGIAGGAEKTRICLNDFGFDAVVDYKSEDVDARMRELCPDGVDVFYDNTSGAISDAVMRNLANNARVVICGTAAIPSWIDWPRGPRVERHLLVKRARMQGFIATDFQPEFPAALEQLTEWVRAAKLRYREDLLIGLDACPSAISRLYRGDNLGKCVVALTPPVIKIVD